MTTSSFDRPLSRATDDWRTPDDEVASEVWRAVETALPSLRSLQRAALKIYGRLEPDRALVWTVEELGELAQAVRREEGPARHQEELGQLTAWMLCLANVLDVDLAAAVEMAIREEISRQLAKYGTLTPYSPRRRADD
jgi:NTP pyrophosphatase (non-canonical NTP hydrolase)